MQGWFLSFCQWLEHARLIETIDDSTWLYPAIEATHFFSFFLLVGTIVFVDLRVLGLAGRRESLSQIAEQLFPWTWISLGLAVVTGFLMFATEATAFLPSGYFRIKLLVILAGVLFAAIIQRNASRWDQSAGVPATARLTALISLLLWIGVILAATEVANHTAV
jgi:hypothetical protein